jgi:lysophospholipase L1-like esterase
MRHCSLLAVILFFPFLSAQTPYDSLYLKSTTYINLTAQFEMSKIESTDVVMLGNSITFGGNWNDLLGREKVVNRGIGGDNTLGMLHRMHSVYNLHPKICFIMAGINDLYADASVETVLSNYIKIIDTLRLHNIVPIIQSTLYVNPKWKRSEEKNAEVLKLNMLLQKYAETHAIEFIDLNDALSSNHILQDQYTTDGVHLTPAAYEIWRSILLPILTRHGL